MSLWPAQAVCPCGRPRLCVLSHLQTERDAVLGLTPVPHSDVASSPLKGLADSKWS